MPALLLLVIGVIFFVVISIFEWSSTTIYPHLFLILGSICIILGIFKSFIRKDQYLAVENHQRLRAYEIYFDVNERDKLIRLTENGHFSELKSLKGSVSSGLKLRFLVTKDKKVCFSQIIAFVGFEYVNVSAPKQHSMAEAETLIKLERERK